MKLGGRRGFTFAYKSATQDIADCNTDIDRLLSEYAVRSPFFHEDASKTRFLTKRILS
jgi:hypothetical protein